VVKHRTNNASILFCVAAACLPAAAQLERVLKQAGATQTAEVATKDAPHLGGQLMKCKAEAEADLERVERLAEFGEIPEGINSSDISQRRRIYDQNLFAVARHLIILDDTVIPTKLLEGLEALQTDVSSRNSGSTQQNSGKPKVP
jgi:hypothetical protein